MATYGRFIHQPGWRSLEISQGRNRPLDELKTVSPADVQTIDDPTAGSRAPQRYGMRHEYEQAARLDEPSGSAQAAVANVPISK